MKPAGSEGSKVGDNAVWERLRTRMAQLQSRNLRTDPAMVAQKLKQRAEKLRSRVHSEVATGAMLTFLAFQNGSQRFGIPISAVLEVLPLDHVSPVPWAPKYICGLIHWRGVIVSLFDLVKLFSLSQSGIADAHAAIVVEAQGHRVALLSGEIDEIHRVPVSELHVAPELPGETSDDWFLGIHDRTRLILDLEKILQDERLTSR